jgi:hypothetical protein
VLPESLKEYPPRQGGADFNIDDAMKALTPKGQ